MCKSHNNGNLDREKVFEILRNTKYRTSNPSRSKILYPILEKDFPHTELDPWFIIVSSEIMMYKGLLLGRDIVGFDAVFKYNRYSYPLWVVTAVDQFKAAFPVCFIIANTEQHSLICHALKILLELMDDRMGSSQPPPSISGLELEDLSLDLRYCFFSYHQYKFYVIDFVTSNQC